MLHILSRLINNGRIRFGFLKNEPNNNSNPISIGELVEGKSYIIKFGFYYNTEAVAVRYKDINGIYSLGFWVPIFPFINILINYKRCYIWKQQD